jgi:DNA adenine methylase
VKQPDLLEELTRPILRYFGGKWRLAQWIISFFPEHRIYVEPFGGAASVLLRKKRSYAEVYNDLNSEVVNLFRLLQNPDNAARLIDLLKLTPYAREEFDLAYILADNDIERARRLLIRSFMGFGSNATNIAATTGFRNNTKRSGTVPAHDWVNYADALPAIVERLKGVVIESRDALEVIGGKPGKPSQHDSPETLFYVDPPYLEETRVGLSTGRKNHQYACEFCTEEQHRQLAETLHGVEGMVVLSGYSSPLYDQLYGDWRRVERKTYADGAKERTEVLWLNPAACAANSKDLFTDASS